MHGVEGPPKAVEGPPEAEVTYDSRDRTLQVICESLSEVAATPSACTQTCSSVWLPGGRRNGEAHSHGRSAWQGQRLLCFRVGIFTCSDWRSPHLPAPLSPTLSHRGGILWVG